MDFPPILNTQDVQLAQTNQPKKKFLFIFFCLIVGFIVIILVCLYIIKNNQKKRVGFLKVKNGSTNKYVNAIEKIFPANKENNAVILDISDTQITSWELQYINNKQFILTTVLNGINYSLQDGAPGTSAPWGIAYIAPMDNKNGRIGKDVQLSKTSTGSLEAKTSPWPLTPLTFLTDSSGVLIWTEQSSTLYILP